MILISKYLVPKGYLGITIFPFVILKDDFLKEQTNLINHEKIHLKQQLELLILFFYLIYAFEWIFKSIRYRSFKKGYDNISFEKEAYRNEANLEYLKSRKFWGFIKYF